MTIPSSGSEAIASTPILVTLVSNASFYESDTTVYRYDLPGSGVAEGWAVPGVIEQIRALSADTWPHTPVTLAGDPAAVEVLLRALADHSVDATVSEGNAVNTAVPLFSLAGDEPLTCDPPDTSQSEGNLPGVLPSRNHAVARPREKPSRNLRLRVPRMGIRPAAIAALVGVLCLVAVAAAWGLKQRHHAAAWGRASSSAESSDVLVESPPPLSAAPPSPVEDADVDMEWEWEGLFFRTPQGFLLEPLEEQALLLGNDDALRIHLAADPLHGVSAAALIAEVKGEIADDESLTELAAHSAHPEGVQYRETPGDGSETTWVAWVEGEKHISVGCQTRSRPTTVQRAACRTIVDTVTTENPVEAKGSDAGENELLDATQSSALREETPRL